MKSVRNATVSFCVLTALFAGACSTPSAEEDGGVRRNFRFEYEATLTGFPAGAEQLRVWLPLPADDEAQAISNITVDAPVPHRFTTEQVYGNRLVYLELAAPLPAEIPVTLAMDVERREVRSVARLGGEIQRERLLAGDQLAPLSTEAKVRATHATRGRSGVEEQARGIYDLVLADVDYDKSGQGWGRGDLAYVCDVGKGNCSDFHTLFIAMARTKDIPAVFEIGFPLPGEQTEGTIGGYHCWAWYQDDDGRWRPVDVSEADKDSTRTEYFFGTVDPNRVAFSRGRDLLLEPRQSGGPVNFLIYPYVEVDGKPDVATVEKSFRFRDLGR